jgi:hypothetical protein
LKKAAFQAEGIPGQALNQKDGFEVFIGEINTDVMAES